MQVNHDVLSTFVCTAWLTLLILVDGYRTRRTVESLRGAPAPAGSQPTDPGENLTARLVTFQRQRFGPRLVGGGGLP